MMPWRTCRANDILPRLTVTTFQRGPDSTHDRRRALMVWSAFEERVSPPERPPWAQNRRRPSMLNVRFLDRPAGHPTARLGRFRRFGPGAQTYASLGGARRCRPTDAPRAWRWRSAPLWRWHANLLHAVAVTIWLSVRCPGNRGRYKRFDRVPSRKWLHVCCVPRSAANLSSHRQDRPTIGKMPAWASST
jgi:hypothetical protein